MSRGEVTRSIGPLSLGTVTETRLDTQDSTAREDVELTAGDAVGRYVVLEELARGGMGVVYAAYDPELDRKIALKLLRSRSRESSDTKGPRARLLREAQALARVTHPHVVTVHDVGTHGSDVFVAMELVEGGTLKSWWTAEDRGWRETLEVLCKAGEGLQAAHEQGVVHRDFKPENVLMGDDGRVAVADFGLARAADVSIERESVSRPVDVSTSMTGEPILDLSVDLTRTGFVLGTPAYMAPEQHRGGSGDIRADVFSFCVTLYEALYGTRPFEGKTMEALASSVLRGELKAPPVDVWVPPAVHQTIVRGLAVDPNTRPATMQELLVELRPAPVSTRRRWALVMGGLLAVTAGGGYALGTSREEPCSPGVERFAGVWDAERREMLAEAFTATGRPFAADLSRRTEAALDRYTTGWSEEARAVCEATHVHKTQSAELLDLRMACLERRADDLRVAVHTLHSGDAELLSNSLDVVRGIPELGACADAEGLRRAALVVDPDNEGAAAELHELLARARVLRDGGAHKEALPVAEQAAAQARELGHAPLIAEALLLLANTHQTSDRVAEARVELEEAMAMAIELGDDRLAARAATAAIYTVGYGLSDIPGAEGWDRQAEGWLARLGRPDRLEALRLDARAIVYMEVGRLDEAMADLRRVQELYDRVLEPNHPSRATTLAHIGDALISQGKYDEAVEHHREAIEIYGAAYGPDHPSLLPPLNNLGVSLLDLGRLEEAQVLFERTYALAEASVGPTSRSAALALRNLSAIDRAQGRLDDAIDRARRALAIYQQTGSSIDRGTASALGTLATALAMAKQFEEATEYFRQSHAAQVKLFGPDSLNTVFAENNLGTVLADQGRYDEGLPHLRSVLAAKERLLGAKHPNLASTLGSIGESLLSQGEAQEALPLFERAEAIQREALGGEHPGVANSMLGRGSCHLELGQVDVALPLLEQALQIREAANVGPIEIARARFAVARALRGHKDGSRAMMLANQALVALEAAGEPAAEDVVEVRAWLESSPLEE